MSRVHSKLRNYIQSPRIRDLATHSSHGKYKKKEKSNDLSQAAVVNEYSSMSDDKCSF